MVIKKKSQDWLKIAHYLEGNKKNRSLIATCLSNLGSGGRIRTDDLRVMSPTSYHCSTPHSLISSRKSGAKVRTFSRPTKFFL